MNLKDARALRDEIREKLRCHCTVPTGHGSAEYFARIWSSIDGGPATTVDFENRLEWLEFWCVRLENKLAAAMEQLTKPRTTLDVMIDRACGRT